VLPLEFEQGGSRESLGLTGEETFSLSGISGGLVPGKTLSVTTDTGKSFDVKARLDTPQEVEYYEHGGILQYVLRQLAAQ
jgi:aconitate hydratase